MLGRESSRLLGGVLLAITGCGWGGPEPALQNLVVISIDTIRADHLGTYGYPRGTSPAIDAFAEDALVFEDAVAPMATTLPSHASLFTGALPLHHGVTSNFRALPRSGSDALPTLAERLRDEGYATLAVTSAAPLAAETGIDRGFEHFDGPPEDGSKRLAPDAVDRALRGLAEVRPPFFLWVHLFDPHAPYTRHPEFEARFAPDSELVELLARRGVVRQRRSDAAAAIHGYDAEIAYTDRQVGRLLDALAEVGRADDTVVVLVGDHGEGLWQHGLLRHGRTWHEQLWVPLIVRIPDGPRGRHRGVAALVDILPTLAANAQLGLDRDAFDGVDLLAEERDYALSQQVVRERLGAPVFTLTGRHWKYWKAQDGSAWLYDRKVDPHELRDASPQHPQLVARLEALLAATLASRDAPTARPASDDLGERLRALGYVE